MTSALEGGEVSVSRPGRSLPRETTGTHCTGDWVGPTAGLDRCGKFRSHRIFFLEKRSLLSLLKFSYIFCKVKQFIQHNVLTALE